MTTTITLTGQDRHRILADLWAVAGLGDHIRSMTVDAPDSSRDDRCYITLNPTAYVAPLAIAHDVIDHPDTPFATSGSVVMTGVYRGVPVMFALNFVGGYVSGGPGYTERELSAIPIAEAALADLNAALEGGA